MMRPPPENSNLRQTNQQKLIDGICEMDFVSHSCETYAPHILFMYFSSNNCLKIEFAKHLTNIWITIFNFIHNGRQQHLINLSILTTKSVGAKQSFIKCSVSNKLEGGSEDHMVNIQGKKRLSNAMQQEVAILTSLSKTKLLGTTHVCNYQMNNLLIF